MVAIRVASRAGLMFAAFAVALVVLPSLRSSVPSRPGPAAAQMSMAIGSRLGLLVPALALATMAAVVVAVVGALADWVELDQPWVGGLVKLVWRLAELPWIAVSPFALA